LRVAPTHERTAESPPIGQMFRPGEVTSKASAPSAARFAGAHGTSRYH
jgi:hypothetical protein